METAKHAHHSTPLGYAEHFSIFNIPAEPVDLPNLLNRDPPNRTLLNHNLLTDLFSHIISHHGAGIIKLMTAGAGL